MSSHMLLNAAATAVSLCLFSNPVFASPPSWTDPDIPVTDELTLWLDGSRVNDARQANGLNPVSVGQGLDVWHDGSGAGHDFSQWTTRFRPVWERNQTVRFNGQQFLSVLLNTEVNLTDATMIVVAAPDRPEGDFPAIFSSSRLDGLDYNSGFVLDFGRHPSSSGLVEIVNIEGGGQAGDDGGNLIQDPISAEVGHVFTITSVAGDSSWLRIDGQEHNSRPRENVPLALHKIAIGARFMEPAMRHFYKGSIAEVLLFNRKLNSEEIGACEQWLSRKHSEYLREPDPDSPREVTLKTVANPPVVQMLVPGFRVDELPIDTTNLNNIEYAPDGRLFAAGYDGRFHVMSDTDGDGLEDQIDTFVESTSEDYPIGLVVKDGMPHAALSDEIVRFRDTDGDGIPDKKEIVVSGWDDPELRENPILLHRRVDSALALAAGPDGSWYVTMGNANPGNGYWQDFSEGNQWDANSPKKGASQYSTDKRRGCLLRIYPDGKVEQINSGVRYIMSLQWDRFGELFGSEQEGATWVPNGNPFDELLHLQAGRHYGFPPAHPTLLPDVIDEPSVWNFAPQHQSTCGFRFNGPIENRARFGPDHWSWNALTTGASRGKLWRTQLARTSTGYVANTHLIAAIQMLAIDCAISPEGDLVVCAHSGAPDWGSGPAGKGKLFKIRYLNQEIPQPVLSYAPDPTTTVISFDRPLKSAPAPPDITLHGGRFVSAGDRLELFRPGYEVVRFQQSQPRFEIPVKSVNLSSDKRRLQIQTAPRTTAFGYSVSINSPRNEPGIEQANGIDLDAPLHGIKAHWKGADGSEWQGWLPHPDLNVIREFTQASAEHQEALKLFQSPGQLILSTRMDLSNMLQPAVQPGSKLDYIPEPETVTLTVSSDTTLTVNSPITEVIALSPTQSTLTKTIDDENFTDMEIQLTTPVNRIEMSFHTAKDQLQRPLGTQRFHMPFVVALKGESGLERVIPEIEGGSWSRGRELYFGKAACFTCHEIRGEGNVVGPDLTNTPHRDYDSVMRDITDPSATINPDAVAYKFTMKDSEAVVIGTRVGETETQLKIASPGGSVTHLDKFNIGKTETLPVSLMPEGLLQALSTEEVRDLMTFLLNHETH